jgi:class 3 adenylate cyclase/dienelactone hydrolase
MLDVPEVRYARIGDGHVAYQVVGDGPIDVLVAPGFISHLDLQWTMPTYASFVEGLASFSRVILFDKRGTGLSDPSPDAARFDQRVEDIEGVMRSAGSEQVVLFGMSEGGPLATLFTATHPDRVAKLILYGTFAAGSTIDQAVLQRFDAAVEKWGAGMTADVFMSPDSRRMLARSYFGLFERASCSPGMARALLDSIKAVDVRAVLPAVTVPTLILHRTDDPFAATLWTDELEDLAQHASRVDLDGDDHLPWLGDHESIVEAVADFAVGSHQPHSPARMFASLLFTDIVDSTRRAVDLGDGAWARLLERHNQLIRSAIEAHRGREIKTLGDGFLSMFSTPGKAVRCAADIVDGIHELGIEVRAGVHSGEIEIVDINDIAGITVHVAARIGAEARANQILVSRAVKDLALGEALAFAPMGTRRLKGVPKPVQLYALDTGNTTRGPITDAKRQRLTDRVSIGALRSAALVRRSLTKVTVARTR